MLFILNRDFKILGLASNESEKTLNYYEDKLHTELTSGVSTFEFTVSKTQEDSKHLQEGNYITFKNKKGKQLLFTITSMEEDGLKKSVYCEDIGLDLLNETKGPLSSPTPQPVSWYIENSIGDSGWEIGVNEITHLSRTCNFDSYTNALGRILSILNSFDDSEVDFTVEFNGNTIAHQYINIYKRRGRETGIRLQSGIDLVEARRTVSIEDLATALIGVGGQQENENPDIDPITTTFNSIAYDDGRYYTYQGGIFDREANKTWSRYRKGQASSNGFIVDFYEYDTNSPQELFNRTFSQLKKRNEPAVTYEVEVDQINKDLDIGDTITVVDTEFNPPLYLAARVLSIDESENDDSKNKIKLGNYVVLESSIDAQLKELQATLKNIRISWNDANQPELSVKSTKGEVFFNNVVSTNLQANILRGGIDTTQSYSDSDFVWTKKDKDGTVDVSWSKTGKTVAITISDLTDKGIFICTVGQMISQISLSNVPTTIKSATAPSNPQQGQLWLDTSITPNEQKIYLSGQWKPVTPVSGEEFTEVKELANVNMQGIASVNTEVAKKVDTTTYTSKVSAIESALANKLETAVANATKLAQDAEIAKKVAQTTYDAKVAEMQTSIGSKLDTATANATKVTQDAAIATKVAQTAYDAKVVELNTAIGTKLSTATATANNLAQDAEIAKKVAQTAYDAKVIELNAALATKLNIIAADATNLAQDAEIAKKVAQTTYDAKVVELNTAIGTKLDSATATTNKLAQDAEIAKKVAQTAYDAKVLAIESTLSSKLDTATANATKAAQDIEIAKKVAQTAYDTKVSALESTLTTKLDTATANAAKIAQDIEIAKKVTQTAYNTKVSELDSAISGHTTRIEATETGLLAKASTTEVDALKTRMNTAETSLTTNANEIALKATKTDLDTVEGRMDTAESSLVVQAGQIASKVATTTYNTGIAAKEDSITKATTAPTHANGKLWLNTSITPNVLNRSTGSTWVKVTPTTASEVGAYSSTDGSTLAGRVTTTETTITQQGNQIALKAAQTDLTAANTRLTTAEGTLVVQAGQIASKVATTDFNAVNTRLGTAESTITQQATQIASKVAQTDFDGVEGRLDTAESSITQQSGEIASKVSTTTYNTGIASKENSIVKATVAPAHVSGLLWLNTSITPNVLNRSTGSAWVKVTPTTAAEVGAYSSTDGGNLAGRVTTAESTIVQQSNSIALKASQTDLNTLDGRLDTAESSLVVQAGQIASKVAQTTFDAVNTRLGTAETTITQQATSIASKVATTTYNTGIALKEDSIVKATVAPTHLNGKLWLDTSVTPNVLNRSTGTAWIKVTPTTAAEVGAYSSTDGSALGTRVTTAESTIVQQGNAIALKASQTDLNSATGRLTTAEGTLVVQAGQIASKVATTDFNAVESRLDTAESSITQQSGEIASKVATTTYNSGIASKEDSITKATVAPAHVNGRLWLDTAVTPNILNRSTGSAWVKVTPTTASEVGAYSSSAGTTLAGKVTTAESTIVQQGNAIALKASQTDLNAATGRITTAESTLTVQAGQIASKVAQTDFNAVEGRLDNAESSIVQQAGEIATKVAQSTFDTANTRLGTAESTISQQATLITSKVAQTDFDTVEGRLGTAESTLTVQAGQIATKVATSTYTSGLALKEEAIVKATTAPTHLLGKLWLNTSVTPNALSRSTGTAWVKVTPTTASEVGAYSSTDGSTLAGRVTTAESTIVQSSNAIALKASQTDLNAIDGEIGYS